MLRWDALSDLSRRGTEMWRRDGGRMPSRWRPDHRPTASLAPPTAPQFSHGMVDLLARWYMRLIKTEKRLSLPRFVPSLACMVQWNSFTTGSRLPLLWCGGAQWRDVTWCATTNPTRALFSARPSLRPAGHVSTSRVTNVKAVRACEGCCRGWWGWVSWPAGRPPPARTGGRWSLSTERGLLAAGCVLHYLTFRVCRINKR